MSAPSPLRPDVPADRLALVTGASRGLGFALAEALAEDGWHVVAVARTTGGLEDLDDRIQAKGGSATLAPMDVTDEKAMAHLAGSIHSRWGGLGLWAHTAIFAAPLSPAGHIDVKEIDKSIACNLRAPALMIGYFEPLLRAANGTALFFDDPHGGEKFFGTYGATKAAQMALVESWRAESTRIGPRVVTLTPRPMGTATRGRFYPGEDRAALADPQAEARRLLGEL